VLTDAAIKGKTDVLHGLKENVITGKMIPAGRGLKTDEERQVLIADFSVEEFMRNIRNNYRESHDQWMDQFDDNLSLDE